jgi:transglutaminase-like putative cysteine protease
MRLTVRHRTAYAYDAPISYAIQTLRLTPRSYEGLDVLRWHVRGESRRPLPGFVDGYGNLTHTHTVNRPHTRAMVIVEGLVETRETHGVVRGAAEPLPPPFYLRRTRLTEPDEAIGALAERARGETLERLHGLMLMVRKRVDYRIGATEVETTAASALAAGAGVCQDHAHVFIAAARFLGIPARYVSGYLWTGHDERDFDANHAWAEAYVNDLGWVGFDPANRTSPTEAYIRTAIGLDYGSAAPVRGFWRGAATERLAVDVRVRQAEAAQ